MNVTERTEKSPQVKETSLSLNDNLRKSLTHDQSMYEWLVENGQAVDDTERTSL
jgi:hypothetical protein